MANPPERVQGTLRRASSETFHELKPRTGCGTMSAGGTSDEDEDEDARLLGGEARQQRGQHISVGDDKDFVVSKWIDFLFLVCGISVFARTEAFFMQTDLFVNCYGLGVNFYPIACGLAFVPGIVTSALQNAYDLDIDRKYGTYKAHMARLVFAASMSVALIVGYFAIINGYPGLERKLTTIGPVLFLIGIMASITWGSVTQITSCLPGRFQIYCFIGSMCPFGLYLPVNVLLGDLCMDVGPRNATHHHNTSTITSISGISITSSTVGEEFGPFMPSEMPATYDKLFVRHIDDVSGGAVGGGGEPPTPGAGSYDFMQDRVVVFFSMCCLLTVVGCLSIASAMGNAAVKRRLHKRDKSIKEYTPPETSGYTNDYIYEDEESPLVVASGSIQAGGDDGDESNQAFQRSTGGGDESAATDSAYEQSMGQVQLAKRIWRQSLSQLLITTGSQLVVSQYVSVPRRHYKSMTTLLLYEYYIGSAGGMIAALWDQTKVGPTTLLVASVVRSAVFPFLVFYIIDKSLLDSCSDMGADMLVQAINIIFCFTNGHLFANTYSLAKAEFKTPAGASRASSTLTVLYYVGISLAICGTIGLNGWFCSHMVSMCGGGGANVTNATLPSNMMYYGATGGAPSSGSGSDDAASSGVYYYLWDRTVDLISFNYP